MIVLNYAHPLTSEQLEQVAALCGVRPQVRAILAHADRTLPLAEAACDLADAARLTADEWQTAPLIVNPPGLAPLALALLAEVHGRRGGFPAILNIRPVVRGVTTAYEVGEIVNLQALRDAARTRR